MHVGKKVEFADVKSPLLGFSIKIVPDLHSLTYHGILIHKNQCYPGTPCIVNSTSYLLNVKKLYKYGPCQWKYLYTDTKEIEMIHRLFLVIAMYYCSASSMNY